MTNNLNEELKQAIRLLGHTVAPSNIFVPEGFGQAPSVSANNLCRLHLLLQDVHAQLNTFRRGELVEIRLAKDKPNGDPNYAEWIVWESFDKIVYVCRVDEYAKWCKKELGTVTINGKVFDELPYHVGLPKRDVRYPQ